METIHPDSDRQANDYEGEREVSEDFTPEEVPEAKRLTSERN